MCSTMAKKQKQPRARVPAKPDVYGVGPRAEVPSWLTAPVGQFANGKLFRVTVVHADSGVVQRDIPVEQIWHALQVVASRITEIEPDDHALHDAMDLAECRKVAAAPSAR